MKKYVLPLFILLAAMLTGRPAFAGDTHTHDHAATTEEAAQDEVIIEPEDLLQEQIKKMSMQMAKINQTKDPAKRHKLLKEHNKSMRTSIRILRNMIAGMEMQHSHAPGGGMMGGSMDGMECEHHRKDGQAPNKVKKIWVCPMHPDEVNDRPGTCRICGMDLMDKAELDAPFPGQGAMPEGMECENHRKGGQASSAAPKKTWICPMHPNEAMNRPGTCRLCGMDLVDKAELDEPSPEQSTISEGMECDHMKDGKPCDHMQGDAVYPMRGMTNTILMLMEQLIEHNEAALAVRK